MTYEEIIKKVSNDLNIPEEVVNYAYKSFWGFIKTSIQELPLKDCQSEEEFDKIKKSFNVPSLGKFYTSYDKIVGLRNEYEFLRNRYVKNKED